MPPVRTRIYLETSLWGFYHDEREVNRWKREAVRELFRQVRAGLFDAYVARPVFDELEASDEPYRSRDIAILESLGPTRLEPDDDQLAALLDIYRDWGVLPVRHAVDLAHVAHVTLSNVNVLVTYNCRHLANYATLQAVRVANMANGFRADFEILTPEQVMRHEEGDKR